MMMPRKPDAKKRKPVGISMPDEMQRAAAEHAQATGRDSLSALIRDLLSQELERAKSAGISFAKRGRGEIQQAKRKMRGG